MTKPPHSIHPQDDVPGSNSGRGDRFEFEIWQRTPKGSTDVLSLPWVLPGGDSPLWAEQARLGTGTSVGRPWGLRRTLAWPALPWRALPRPRAQL